MTQAPAATAVYNGFHCTMRDGLSLYARHYKSAHNSGLRPVLCLAGLTRNSRDFDTVATALANHEKTPRDVFTLDMRGRGLSDSDPEWRNYAVPIEVQDVIDFMTAMELNETGIIGTSRGGLITHALAAIQPARIGPVVLNDIGPIIDINGIVRISGYVGKTPIPKSWPDAARAVRGLTQHDFPNLTDADIDAFARQIFNEKDGRPVAGYDPKLSKCLSVLDGPIPPLWPQFESLKRVPIMVIRGANSDLLSKETVAEMQRRHPNLRAFEVADEGHAPLLRDTPTINAIADFFAATDGALQKAA